VAFLAFSKAPTAEAIGVSSFIARVV
jgi:hypothetical protein